ncbi:MAG: zinc ribbon domain-containing protein [Clostridia bacterium]|nr:zinc ribbon domain-containing protein [Clostridia bacterium]
MNLTLGNLTLEINENFILYNEYKKHFITVGINTAKKFYKQYFDCEDIESALQNMIKINIEGEQSLIDYSCKILFKHGVYDISPQLFEDKYSEKYFDIVKNKNLSPIWDTLEEITNYQEELQDNLELRKASRGHWEGGGFGVGGAIKGAITASAMNAVGGIFHGIGDSIRSASNNSKINRLKEDIYKDTETVNRLCYAIFQNCSNVFYGLIDELTSHNIISDIEFKTQEAIAMNENAIKYAPNEQVKQELLIRSIFMSPYTSSLYDTLNNEYPSIEGLKEFKSYFAVDKIRAFQKFLSLNAKLKTIEKLSDYNFSYCWDKLIAYINLWITDKYQAKEQIDNLINLILNKYSTTVDMIDKGIDYASKNVPQDLPETQKVFIQNIIKKISDKKTDIINQKEYNSLCDLPDTTSDDILYKIEKILEHCDNKNRDETTKINLLFLKLANKGLPYSNLKEAIKKLGKFHSNNYQLLPTVLSAFDIRLKLTYYEEQCQHFSIYTFSPVIVDTIKEARKGNAVCQQWLNQLISNDGLIRVLNKSILGYNTKEKQRANDICDFLTSVVTYLFDNPEKHTFDLFMRLKINSIYSDNIQEYMDAIKIFSEDTLCVVGMYEYGYLVYKHSNKYEGINIIKKAAELGYRKAIDFMYEYHKSINQNSKEILFYEIISAGLSEYKEMYALNSEDIDEDSLTTLSKIKELINIEYSPVLNGDKTFSEFLYSAWKDFSDSPKLYHHYENIGYAAGDVADKMILKTVKLFLGSKINEKAFFSVSTKDSEDAIILTDKSLRWKNGEDVHYKPYTIDVDKDLVGLFRKINMEECVLYHLYVTTYYSCKAYSANLPIDVLEKMAFCGNPLAICNLLSNNKYSLSDDKKDFWIELKKKWEAQGKYFAVCPNCHEVRTKEDMFCPECGAKIY